MKRLAFLLLVACNTTSTTPSTSSPAPAVSSAPPPAVSTPPPATTSCGSDTDCASFSSYCGDLPCACIAHLKSAGAPKCNQPNAVKCLVDPCQRKTAACQDGKCVVVSAGATTQ